MRPREWLLVAGAIAAYFAMEAHEAPEQKMWRMRRSSDPGMAQMEIEHRRGFETSRWTSDAPWSSFKGLTREQAGGPLGKAQFALVRDAGALLCEGTVRFGSGWGAFVFKPDPDFAAELAKLGYSAPNEDELWQLAVHDVSGEFARAVRDAGMEASIGDLKRLRGHGVTMEEIRETQAAGLALPAGEFVRLRDHGAKPGYMRELREAGYNFDADSIVQLRSHGVTTEFARTARTLGYDFGSGELVELRNHGVDSAYLRRLKDAGYANLEARQIARLRDHGID
jgi:hypothetical protein